MDLNSRVRLALPSEAKDIVALQRLQWASDPLLSPTLAQITATEMTQIWYNSITNPPLAHYRILIALSSDKIVGFAAIGPCQDPDSAQTGSEVLEFIISPSYRGKGHGSRLLNAVVDTMRADGYQYAVWWINNNNDELRVFLNTTGWGADGAYRELSKADDTIRVKQLRMQTDISLPDH